MSRMKVATRILSVVAALLVALIVSFFVGGTLSVEARVTAVPATEALAAFAEAKAALESGLVAPFAAGAAGATGAAGAAGAVGEASDYQMVDVELVLNNRGLFAAEWLSAALAPAAGDVAVYAGGARSLDVAARSSQTLHLKLLAAAGGETAGREVVLEYYVLGMRRTVRVACP